MILIFYILGIQLASSGIEVQIDSTVLRFWFEILYILSIFRIFRYRISGDLGNVLFEQDTI